MAVLLVPKSANKLQDALMRMKPGEKDKWQTRAFVAMMEDPGIPMERGKFAAIFMAACGIRGVTTISPIGESAVIETDGIIWAKFMTFDTPLCKVDDLNRALGWLVERIKATDDEYTEIMNKVRAWFVRDKRQLADDIERRRAAWENK